MFSVIIPTRGIGDFSKLLRLLESIQNQTLQPEEILIIIDFDIPKTPLQKEIVNYQLGITNYQILCQDGYGVSAARNWGIKKAKGEYVLLCDDDIRFDESDTIERMIDEYNSQKLSNIVENRQKTNARIRYAKDGGYNEDLITMNNELGTILYPTITFHDTGRIQTQGFASFNRLLCRPVPRYSIEWKSKLRDRLLFDMFELKPDHGDVQLIGSICLLSTKATLERNLYDEEFGFIYEDLEWSYRAYKNGVSIYIADDIQVQHWEAAKGVLERSYIDKPDNVYRKTKHRIWFVLKHATNWQLLLFYIAGFWISNGWTLLYILLYGKRKNNLIQAWWRGIKDGLSYKNEEG